MRAPSPLWSLIELGAETARFNADDRVEPRIVLVVALEHLDADRVSFNWSVSPASVLSTT